MSTLEELKKQVVAAKLQEEDHLQSTVMKLQKIREDLLPVMKHLIGHFKELAETLNTLNKGGLVDFEISKNIKLKNLRSQNYIFIQPNDDDREMEFYFQFENKGKFPLSCRIQVGPIADKLSQLLLTNNISCSRKQIDDNFFKFEINSFVKTRYYFTANMENGRIDLVIRNYDHLWKQKNSFSKDDITQQLLDALTKHVMREENRYDEIVGNVISAEAKTEFKAKLKKDAELREAQQKAANAQQQDTKKAKTLLGRLLKKST